MKPLSDTILKSYTLKLFLFLLIATLSACDSFPTKPSGKPASEKQTTLIEDADRLLELAEDSGTDAEEQAYRTAATHLYIQSGEINLAKEQLEILKNKKIQTATDTADIQIISGEIAIAEKNSTLANQIITGIKPVTRDQELRLNALSADLDYLSSNYISAVDRRIQLHEHLVDAREKMQNNNKIWAALSSMPTTQLNSQKPRKPVTKGWFELAKVMRRGQQNISQLEDNLLDWGTRYPTHPVNDTFLHELINNYQTPETTEKRIAVLLPAEGKMATVTSVIKNGLLSAYYQDSKSTDKPLINFYDTSDARFTFDQLYQQALDDGATNIIGPLDKAIITQLSQQRDIDIPILSLNYSDDKVDLIDNLFQFGLAPEDEARQVAELAVAQGKFRAAVFYPDNEWGQRLRDAFTEHYEYLGGRVITTNDYATNTNDYRRPIRQLFNLDQSAIRVTKIQNALGKNVQSYPHRRQDIDMIFLAATHRSARSIMPAFKFHHAGDLTVYATSHVYTGKVNKELDRDLNGLIFCDLPWILQNNSPLSKTFTKNWPQQQYYTRFFAFGIDAYHLIDNLDYLANNDYASYAGQTGNMQLDDYNRITRKLLWAKFRKGKPIYFEPVIKTQERASIQN